MSFKAKVNVINLNKSLSKLSYKIKDFTEPLKTSGNYMVRETDKNFKKQETPDGKKWNVLSEVTKSNRKKGKGKREPKILQDTGTLKNSIDILKTTKLLVEIGTNKDYGKTHQEGARKGKYGTHTATVKPYTRKVSYITKKGTVAKNKRKQQVSGYKKKIVVPWGNIPARPFIGFNEKNIERINNIFKKWIRELIKKDKLESTI